MHTLTLALRSLLIGTFLVDLAYSAPLAIRQAQVGFEIGFGPLKATVPPISPLDALLDGTSTAGESGATPSAVSQTSGVSSSTVITSTTPGTSQATLTVSSTTSPSSAPATPSSVSSTTSISSDSVTPSTPTSLSSESQAPPTTSATTPPSSDSLTSSTEPITTSSVEAPDATPLPSSDRIARPLVMGYYADWTAGNFPPEKVDFSRYDWIDFAFVTLDPNHNLAWDDPSTSPDLLRRLVTAAHAKGKNVKLSIGGWGGSKHFSSAVASADARAVSIRNIVAAYKEFGINGIDIDWEYPARQGDGSNEVSSTDSANFLSFLQELRAALPREAKISAATQSFPFADQQGQPMKDTREFATVLDWIVLMNYDVWGASENPGPNAPLYDKCGDSTQPEASALAAYQAWTKAGFPSSKLVLGLPAYGYVSSSSAERLRTRSTRSHMRRAVVHPADPYTSSQEHRLREEGADEGDSNDGDTERPKFVQVKPAGSQVLFRELFNQGALKRSNKAANGVQQYVGAGGFTRLWDDCSSTPYLRSTQARQVITYDDPTSLAMKARFVKKTGMLAINMWEVSGDTDDGDLFQGIWSGFSQ